METRMESVVTRVTAGDVQADPFPFFIRPDCMSAPCYGALAETCIDYFALTANADKLQGRSNQAFGVSGMRFLRDWPWTGGGGIPPIWRELFEFHISQPFYHQTISLLGPQSYSVFQVGFCSGGIAVLVVSHSAQMQHICVIWLYFDHGLVCGNSRCILAVLVVSGSRRKNFLDINCSCHYPSFSAPTSSPLTLSVPSYRRVTSSMFLISKPASPSND